MAKIPDVLTEYETNSDRSCSPMSQPDREVKKLTNKYMTNEKHLNRVKDYVIKQ